MDIFFHHTSGKQKTPPPQGESFTGQVDRLVQIVQR